MQRRANAETAATAMDVAPVPRLGYRPGLDGLRAVALLAIFVVHADIGMASGGFLAVSTFFTLSGFLITTLLVIEHRTSGRISLRAFWMRRARRLLPASLLSIAAISLATLALGTAGQIHRLPGDALATMAYVANWRFILLGDRYGAGFEGEPTLLHFWSLAIEEQFYVLFPVFALAAFSRTRRWPNAPAALFLVGAAASLAAGIAGSLRAGRTDRLYFATDVRAAELLVGALLGLWWVARPERRLPGLHWLGPAALLLMLVLIGTAHHQDRLWYRGGLVAYALVTSVVVLAAIDTAGLVQALLSWRPLVAIGIVSYGAYLVHWPIFLWLRTGTSIAGGARLVIGTAASIALAALLYRYLEEPIRRRRLFSDRALLAFAGGLAVLVVGLNAVGAPRVLASRGEIVLADAGNAFERSLATTMADEGTAPTVAVFGDSTALVTSVALAQWDDTNPAIRTVQGWANLGCSITFPGDVRNKGVVSPAPPVCAGWLDGWTRAAERAPDVAFVQFGPWEVYELKPAGMPDFAVIGDPALDAVIGRNLAAGLEALLARAKVVAVATSPHIERDRLNGRSPERPLPESDPSRMDRLNAIIREVAGRYDRVAVIDLAGYLATRDDDRRLRPDGVHFTAGTARELADLLGPTLAALAPRDGGPPAGDPTPLPIVQRPRSTPTR